MQSLHGAEFAASLCFKSFAKGATLLEINWWIFHHQEVIALGTLTS
jgi:hypothetical protein